MKFNNLPARTAAMALTAGLALSGANVVNAEAAVSPCPSVAELGTANRISAGCKSFLLRKLDATVYLEGSKLLEVATYQKEAGLQVDGVLGPKTAIGILRNIKLQVPSPRPRATEFLVDKRKQVAYDIVNGVVKHEISVSTGTEQAYSDPSKIDGHLITGVAHTPVGKWQVFRREGPTYASALGPMPNARFYNSGFAVHEDPTSVHGRGSHGCVRVDHGAMPLIINDLHIGATVEVVEHL